MPMHPASLSIHYVYSFLLTGDAVIKAQTHKGDLHLRDVPSPEKHFVPYLGLLRAGAVLEPDLLDLPINPGPDHTEAWGEAATLELGGGFRTEKAWIRRRFHLDRSGACGYVIQLTILDALPITTIISIASAAEDSDSATHLKAMTPPPAPNSATWTLDRLSTPPAGRNPLEHLFISDVRLLTEALAGKATFDWLDDPVGPRPLIERQLPFVLTVLRFADEKTFVEFIPEDADFAEKPRTDIGLRRRRFGALLFRWKTGHADSWEDVDLTYLSGARGRGAVLSNMHVHRDLFISTNIRSTVVACNVAPASGDGAQIASFTVPALEAGLAADRAQWHAYLIVNALLERDADELCSHGIANPDQVLGRLIARKSLVMRVLDSTTSYRLASDTLWSLHRHLADLLGISDLRVQALAKLELLDSLLATARQYYVLRQTQAGLPSRGDSQNGDT